MLSIGVSVLCVLLRSLSVVSSCARIVRCDARLYGGGVLLWNVILKRLSVRRLFCAWLSVLCMCVSKWISMKCIWCEWSDLVVS